MPGEVVLQCTACHAVTRYVDLYKNGKFCVNHEPECVQKGVEHPRMNLTRL